MRTNHSTTPSVAAHASAISTRQQAPRSRSWFPCIGRSARARQQQIESTFRCDRNAADLKPKKPARFAHIGVVDGMGPMAGIKFCEMLVNEGFSRLEQDEQVDQKAPTFTLDSMSSEIPDRTDYLMKRKIADAAPAKRDEILTDVHPDNPLWGMRESIERVRQCGAKVYVVTCNTAHAFAAHFPTSRDFRFVHIVDAALNEAAEQDPIQAKLAAGKKIRIGLLATEGTVKSRIYHDRLAERGKYEPKFRNMEFVVPSTSVQANEVTAGIYRVKANDIPRGRELLHAAAKHLIEKEKVDALSLSCTEIPIVVKQEHFRKTPIIDASAALAREAIKLSMAIRSEELKEQSLLAKEQRAKELGTMMKAWQTVEKARL